MGIKENIIKIRKYRMMSREDLEKASGIKGLYQKETGRRGINEEDLEKLSVALKCLKSDLVGDTESYKNYVNDSMQSRFFKLILSQKFYDKESFERYISSGQNYTIFNHERRVFKEMGKVLSNDGCLISFLMDGNYMYSHIFDGDFLIINTSSSVFFDNQIYLVSESGELKIRRIKQPRLDIDEFI